MASRPPPPNPPPAPPADEGGRDSDDDAAGSGPVYTPYAATVIREAARRSGVAIQPHPADIAEAASLG
jgi:hypothetical protein